MTRDHSQSRGEANETRRAEHADSTVWFGQDNARREQVLCDLIGELPDLVLCVAPDGDGLLYANHTTLRVLGYDAPTLAQLNFVDLLADESVEEFEELREGALNGASVGPVELTLVDTDAKKLTVEAKLNCRFEGTEPAWLRVVLRDLRTDIPEMVVPDFEGEIEAEPTPRILVVEDDDLCARMLARLLERGGYETERAATGSQAIEMLEEGHYDAMTLDLMLPDRDGVDLLHQIRADEELAQLPVIIVSASADEARHRLTGDAANVADWLNKPFDAASLRNALTRAVDVGEGELPRVLHVEDDNAFCEEVRQTLAEFATIDRAATLADARRMLKDNEDYDLVLLDLTLPDGLGAELLPYLNRPRGRSVPVILVSATETVDALAAHVADTLNKSHATQRQILETIRAHLRK
ncbi:response regulator [Persicimonas caeni]|uniref:Response regulator n=1 Tax=Persicimonas caeni TaxID=2292766 RepID=A0A4Y6PPS2_PERCE|nr:response regulator [Persicimonas caeni]QDG50351.1 response regulator [Persicimonas caeni]QED31572.1 response regulator [Persicimonas caeni]